MNDSLKPRKEQSSDIHFRRYGREWAMQFMFQNDIDQSETVESAVNRFKEELNNFKLFDENTIKIEVFKRASKAALKLIEGVLTNIKQIDEILSNFSPKWTLDRMDCVDRNVMRIAVYEMLYCDNVPPIVSIDEAVEIAKKYGSENSASFVNGILNAVKETLNRPFRKPNKK